jgi:hypothetical protein
MAPLTKLTDLRNKKFDQCWTSSSHQKKVIEQIKLMIASKVVLLNLYPTKQYTAMEKGLLSSIETHLQ